MKDLFKEAGAGTTIKLTLRRSVQLSVLLSAKKLSSKNNRFFDEKAKNIGELFCKYVNKLVNCTSDKLTKTDDEKLSNSFYYIYAAAGRTVWYQGLSLLSACGFFIAFTSKSSDL